MTSSGSPVNGAAGNGSLMYGKAYMPHIDSSSSSCSSYTPLDVERYLCQNGPRREASALRALIPFMSIPGMISLGGGMPNPALFPFQSISVTMKDGFSYSITSSDEQDMTDAFQYTGTAGINPLLTELRTLVQREHSPLLPPSAWSVAVTNGSQDGLAKMVETLLGPEETVLTETPTYSGALSIFRALRCNIVGLPCDGKGIIPERMEEVMEGWDVAKQGARPKVLYIIPVGQNPAGSSMTVERKRKVYEMACRYDMIVMEDDPYYFLSYGEALAPADDTTFVRPIVPSMWSMDTEGRVIRFDSLSKVFSSGLRLGFVTGPVGFINKMLFNVQATNLHSSGISQLMAAKWLQHLGETGWKRHVDAVSLFYLKRRDLLISYCEKYLKGLVSFTVPHAGMFVWFKLLHIADSKKLIEGRARKALVLLVPGQVFMPDDASSNYVRASFSLASEPDMEVAIQRLGQVLREEGKAVGGQVGQIEAEGSI